MHDSQLGAGSKREMGQISVKNLAGFKFTFSLVSCVDAVLTFGS